MNATNCTADGRRRRREGDGVAGEGDGEGKAQPLMSLLHFLEVYCIQEPLEKHRGTLIGDCTKRTDLHFTKHQESTYECQIWGQAVGYKGKYKTVPATKHSLASEGRQLCTETSWHSTTTILPGSRTRLWEHSLLQVLLCPGTRVLRQGCTQGTTHTLGVGEFARNGKKGKESAREREEHLQKQKSKVCCVGTQNAQVDGAHGRQINEGKLGNTMKGSVVKSNAKGTCGFYAKGTKKQFASVKIQL